MTERQFDQAEASSKWLTFSKPLDISDVVKAVVVILGGFWALAQINATINAKMDFQSQQIGLLTDRLDKGLIRLDERIDKLMDGTKK